MVDRYRLADRAQHEAPACPACGHRVVEAWIDVTCSTDPEPMATPGRWECETPNCQYGRSTDG